MIPDLDIYRSANVLVTRHGADAPIYAATRADAMLEFGDLDGSADHISGSLLAFGAFRHN